jgi:hypothetical protein
MAAVAGQQYNSSLATFGGPQHSDPDCARVEVSRRDMNLELWPLKRKSVGKQSDRRTHNSQHERAHRECGCEASNALVKSHRRRPNENRYSHRDRSAGS